MYKAQIFQEVLSAVAEETEIEKQLIISTHKQEEVVDARSILIRVMYEKGLYPVQISRITGMGLRSVTRYLQLFKERSADRKMMRINYESIRTKLGIS